MRDECQSWVDDGECENNPALMRRKCPGKCKAKPKATKAKAKKPAEDEGPPDNSPHCSTWAAVNLTLTVTLILTVTVRNLNPDLALDPNPNPNPNPNPGPNPNPNQSGECGNNPDFMLKECAASCRGGGKETSVDMNQDCAPWVSDGECFRDEP